MLLPMPLFVLRIVMFLLSCLVLVSSGDFTPPAIPVISPAPIAAPAYGNPTTFPPPPPLFTNPPSFLNPITFPPPPPPPPAVYTAPTTSPTAPTIPVSSRGGAWCIASSTASETALQVAMDYACGYAGVDCSAIQQSGSCYNPNTLRDHASYAFNSYYVKNPGPTSCVFGGAAHLTYTDPSSGSCHFATSATAPGTSSSSTNAVSVNIMFLFATGGLSVTLLATNHL